MSFNRSVDKHTGVYQYNGMLFNDKKKWAMKSWKKAWSNLKYVLLRERSKFENATDCTISTMWHSEKGNDGAYKGQW